jgi:hypothetical protein
LWSCNQFAGTRHVASVMYVTYYFIDRLLNIKPNYYVTFDVKKSKLHGLSPRANYTDRATAACRRSDCQLVRIEGATWSA